MFKINDKWFRILIIVLPFLEGIWANNLLVSPFNGKWIATALISLCTLLLVCEGSRFIIYNSRKWFKTLPYNATRRMIACIVAGVLYTMVIIAMNLLAYRYLRTGQFTLDLRIDSNVYVNNTHVVVSLWNGALIKAAVYFSILLAVYETFYYFARLKFLEKEREWMEKGKLKAELQQLKGIVNPHFLFNNLNSLSALISENPPQAEIFLDELTKVFRYLLKNNETELTTLNQELQFIQSYYNLLRTRYGKGISMHLSIDQEYNELLIPPLTLQLLVENAVKHNRIQAENPLLIELLAAPGNKLVVRNNVSVKEGKSDSTGIGLQNIYARYKMLNLPVPVIEKGEIAFAVIIPLAIPNAKQQKPVSTAQPVFEA